MSKVITVEIVSPLSQASNLPLQFTGLFEKRGVYITFIKCKNNAASFGYVAYSIQFADKKKAWYINQYSCGSGGCSKHLTLFLEDKKTIEKFKCH